MARVGALIVVVIVVLVYIAIGFYFRTGARKTEGYFVAGRNVGVLVSSGAIAAAFMSGATAMGSVALAYSSGSYWVAITSVGCVVGLLIGALLTAAAFRRLELNSIPEFIEVRYGRTARIVALIAMGLTYIIYTTLQLKAMGLIGAYLFGWPYIWSMVLFAVVTFVYVALGGMYAVIWTDFLQMLFMMFMALLMGIVTWMRFGGITDIYNSVGSLPGVGEWMWSPWGKVGFPMTFSWAFIYTLVFMPHLLVRFYAAKSPDVARKSGVLSVVWFSIFCAIMYWAVGPAINLMGLQFKDVDNALIYGKDFFFKNNPIILGLLLSGILAAVLSSASALLHTATTSLSYDVFKAFRLNVPESDVVRYSRLVLLAVTIASILLAIKPLYVLSRIGAESVVLLALAAGFPITIGILWKRASEKAVIWSVIITWTIEFVQNFTPYKVGAVGGWLPGLWTSLISIALIITLSLIWKPKTPEIEAYERIHGVSASSPGSKEVGEGVSISP